MLTPDCKSSYVCLWTLKRRGALFSQCIVSRVLMALLYIHNTITWIQMWHQCVVFLQQTLTSKYTPSLCSLQLGPTIIRQKPKIVMKCQTTVSQCTFSILRCLPTSSYNSHKHLHTAKINTFRSVTLTHAASCLGKLYYSRNFLHSLLCSYNSHTNHCPEQINPIQHTFPPDIFKIHFNITLSAMSSSSK